MIEHCFDSISHSQIPKTRTILAMARLLYRLSTIVLLALISVRFAVSADPPSPTPAPEIGADSLSPSPESGAPETPSPSPEFSSPPAPPPSDLAPGSSPSPSPSPSPDNSPSPSPSVASDLAAEKSNMNADSEDSNESSEGMKGGQKAGIVLGVIAGACLVGFGGMVYKKRQQNIQRSQYGYAARGEFL